MSSARENFRRSSEHPQARARAMVDQYRRYARDWPLQKTPLVTVSGDIGPTKPVNATRIERLLGQYPANTPLELLIDSNGGLINEAKKIYAVVRGHPGHVSARVLGSCCSAATIILLAATWREAVPEAKFLLHDSASDPDVLRGYRMTSDSHALMADHLRRLNSEIAGFCAQRTGKPLSLFQAEMKEEKEFSAQRAKELGLINTVTDRREGMEPLVWPTR